MLSIVSWYFGVDSGHDVKAYIGMALECHPVWQDLALHRVYDRQPVTMQKGKPLQCLWFGTVGLWN
jgi:hypothetical protein